MAIMAFFLAAAGGGSGGFGGGGGGGGGGGFGGGGGGFGGGGGGFAGGGGGGGGIFLLVLIAVVVVFVLISSALATVRYKRRRRARVAQVRLAAAEAADDDPAFDSDTVQEAAVELFERVQAAWDKRDLAALEALAGADLLVEWRRRLDDFAAKGWHNVVKVRSGPEIEYVGLVNRSDDADDRVCVRVEAALDDWVATGGHGVLYHDGKSSAHRQVCEYWTLGKRNGGWVLLSIEQRAEGDHNLDSELVASPWSDTGRLRDAALVEGAVAEAPPDGFATADLADLDFDGDARAAALDLSLADGRFAPDVLEAAARRAVDGWLEAVDGADDALAAVATPAAVRALLHPGDTTGEPRTRLVVRGARIEQVRIEALDAATDPARMTLAVALRGRRYIEDRDTTTVLSGNPGADVRFTERWVLALQGDAGAPWRIVETGAAVGAG